VTYSGGDVTFYRDGFPVGVSHALNEMQPSGVDLRIGSNASRTRDFEGAIDDLHIFDTALTWVEILDLAEAP